MLKMKLTMKLPSNMAVTESSLREIGTVSGRVGFYRPQLVSPRNGIISLDAFKKKKKKNMLKLEIETRALLRTSE